MNISALFLMVLVVFMSSAQAQVRKCVSSTGKITYSDFVCEKDTSNESAVSTRQNNVDMSASRKEVETHNKAAAQTPIQTTPQIIGGKQATPDEIARCKFEHYAYGDPKGKSLAAAAKQECLDNITAKANGQPTSQEQYGFWKDHQQIKSTQRSKPATSMNCVPNGLGGLRCN